MLIRMRNRFSKKSKLISSVLRGLKISAILKAELMFLKKSAAAVVWASRIIVPLENLIDFNEEIARQQKKLDKLTAEKKSMEGRINNPKFVANAPKELIEQTKDRINEITLQEKTIEELINSLKN